MGNFEDEQLKKENQQVLLKQFLDQEQKGEIRTALNVHQQKNGYDAFLYNEEVTQTDADLLGELLSSETLEITEEERARLEAMQARNLAHLLVNKEKTTGDSKEMTKVKETVIAVEQFLNEERKVEFSSPSLAIAGVERMLALYDEAIKACQYYCDNKNPTFAKGKERKRQVEANLTRLVEENTHMVRARELLRDGTLDGKVTNYRSLLIQSKVAAFAKIQAGPEEAEPQVERRYRSSDEASEAEIKKAGPEVLLMYQMMSGKMRASDIAEGLKKSKKTKDLAAKLPAVFAEFRKVISGFEDGVTGVGAVQVGSGHVTVVHDSKNRIKLCAGGLEIPMERNVRLMLDALDEDMISHESMYGEEQVTSVVKEYVNGARSALSGGDEARARFMLTKYLAAKTKRNAAEFNDVSMENMLAAIRYISHGNELKGAVLEGLLGDEAFDTINGVETRRLVEHQKVREQVEQLDEHAAPIVTYEQKAEEQQADENEPVWTEQETKVKDLIADMLYSLDTWETDAKKAVPGQRVRDVLLRNREAIVYLVSDLYQAGDKKHALVNGILDKLPLFMLDEEKENEKANPAKSKVQEMKQKLAEQLDKITKSIDAAIESEVKAKLGNAANMFTTFLGVNAAKGTLMLAQKDQQNFQKVMDMITDLLEGVDLTEEEAGEQEQGEKQPSLAAMIRDAETSIDGMADSVSSQMQDMVSEIAGEVFDSKEKEEGDPMPQGALEKLEWGEKKLNKMVVDAMKGGDHGAGAFNREIFQNYFASVSAMDQRSMLASAIRSAKPVRKFPDPKEPNISKDEKKKREEVKEKVIQETMGNYLGGLLKGAGPLFQKIMQGLPAEGMPEELQEAIKDMKSRLAPIPEKVVKAQLASMVERSNGKVTRIDVSKALGSASVGQTFLCRMYGPDLPADGEEVVVKLLKPDVRNRMEREKGVLLQCAKNVDEGTYETYKGQLARIEEELDLTIEARNLEKGRIYNKPLDDSDEYDEVTSMELHTLVAPTVNSMVLKKAEGMPIDRYLDSITEEEQKILDPFFMRDPVTGKILMEKDEETGEMVPKMSEIPPIRYEGADGEMEKRSPVYAMEQLAKLLVDLQNRTGFVLKYAEKWTKEGVFEEGFYHGDPHEGNIMVSENKLTVIDYGNATTLDKTQQEHITKMLCAAAVGDMETFRHGFHLLLNPEFEEKYQENREVLGREFKKIFSLGDKKSSGQRIMVCLLKAQELGLEVPGAVYNLSQGQMRLQNTIDHMNKKMTELQKFMLRLQDKETNFSADPSFAKHSFQASYEKIENTRDVTQLDRCYQDTAEDLMFYTNSKEDIKEWLDEEKESYAKLFETNLLSMISKPKEYDIDLAGELEGLMGNVEGTIRSYYTGKENAEKIEDEAQRNDMLKAVERSFEAGKRGFFKQARSLYCGKHRKYFDENIWDDIRLAFETRDMKLVAKIRTTVNAVIEKEKAQQPTLDDAVAAYDEMKAAYKAFADEKKRLKDKYKKTSVPLKEQANLEALRDRFVDLYMPYHDAERDMSSDYQKMLDLVLDPAVTNAEEIKQAKTDAYSYMHSYLQPGAYRAEELKAAMDEFWAEREKNGRYAAASDRLREVWVDVNIHRLRERKKTLRKVDTSDKSTFIDVMANVIDKKTSDSVSRVGFFKSIRYGWNLKSQTKRRERLEKEREENRKKANVKADDDGDDDE